MRPAAAIIGKGAKRMAVIDLALETDLPSLQGWMKGVIPRNRGRAV
jgi:hypothetical protein